MLFWMSEFVEAVAALHDKPANNRGIESLSRKGCECINIKAYVYLVLLLLLLLLLLLIV